MTGTVRAVCASAALLLFVAQGSYARAQEQSGEVSRVHSEALPSVAARHASLPASRSPTSIRDVDLRPHTSGVRYTASPEDWRDAEVYLVMPDRFERGRGAIPSGDQANGRSWHGGNIRGLIDRLPYIRPVANTLWITPVLRNSPDSYHGYGAVNLLDVDPRYGTLDDYKELVDAAHGLGMRVVMDFVFNHAGNVFSYRNGEQRFGPGQKEIGPIHRNLAPSELRSAEHFSRRGVAAGDQWNDEDAIFNADFGDPDNAFEPLRDFATDNPATQSILIRTAMHWMRTTNIDGMRLDTVKHTAPGLWPRVAQTLTAYARALRSPDAPDGKRNFLLLGEIFSGDRNVLGRQLGPYGRGLNSVFDFASAFGNRAALQGKAATSALERNFHDSKAAFGERAPYLTQFHENHDVPRFLREGDPREQLDVATAHTLFSSGMPQLFYGNEQAMPQMDDGNPNTGDPGNRPDMFAGQYKPRALIGRSSFDPNSAAYRRQQSMIAVRRAFDPLRRGEQWVRYSNPNGPGGYVFSRIHNGQEVVVAINTSDRPIDLDNVYVDSDISGADTELVDALDDGYRTQTRAEGGGSQIRVQVPPRGVRVLVSRPLYESRRVQIQLARTTDRGPTGIEPRPIQGNEAAQVAPPDPARSIVRAPVGRTETNPRLASARAQERAQSSTRSRLAAGTPRGALTTGSNTRTPVGTARPGYLGAGSDRARPTYVPTARAGNAQTRPFTPPRR